MTASHTMSCFQFRYSHFQKQKTMIWRANAGCKRVTFFPLFFLLRWRSGSLARVTPLPVSSFLYVALFVCKVCSCVCGFIFNDRGLLKTPFTPGNPFLGTNLLGFNVGRGSGVMKGFTRNRRKSFIFFFPPLFGVILGLNLTQF